MLYYYLGNASRQAVVYTLYTTDKGRASVQHETSNYRRTESEYELLIITSQQQVRAHQLINLERLLSTLINHNIKCTTMGEAAG